MDQIRNLTVAELKERLRSLGLSQSGNKSELMLRLEAAEIDGGPMRECRSPESPEASAELDVRDLPSMNIMEDRYASTEQRSTRGLSESNTIVPGEASNELEWIRKERELLRRERELMDRERTLMRREDENIRHSTCPTTTTTMPRPSINDISELLDEFDGSEDSFGNWER